MRICLLTRFFDMRNAGIGRVSKEVKDRLIQRGHDVICLSVNSESHLSYAKYTGWDLRRLPKADVYHALTPMEAIWLPKQHSVATFLDLIPLTNPDKAGARMGYNTVKRWLGSRYFWIGAYFASKCRRIMCISEQTKKDLMSRFKIDESEIRVIRLGISPELKPEPKKDSVFRIGYLGQLDRRKRVDLLIKAFRESTVDGELVIGGTGIDETKLKALAGNDKRIRFLGFVPESHMYVFYNNLDVFVFPTAIEGYGLPIVEAMACKKPVVVLADSIIPSELKNRCYQSVNEYNFVEIIKHGWFMDSCKESNYEFAKSHDWEKCIDEIEELYQEVE